MHIGKRKNARPVYALALQVFYNVSVRFGVPDKDGLSRFN